MTNSPTVTKETASLDDILGEYVYSFLGRIQHTKDVNKREIGHSLLTIKEHANQLMGVVKKLDYNGTYRETLDQIYLQLRESETYIGQENEYNNLKKSLSNFVDSFGRHVRTVSGHTITEYNQKVMVATYYCMNRRLIAHGIAKKGLGNHPSTQTYANLFAVTLSFDANGKEMNKETDKLFRNPQPPYTKELSDHYLFIQNHK